MITYHHVDPALVAAFIVAFGTGAAIGFRMIIKRLGARR